MDDCTDRAWRPRRSRRHRRHPYCGVKVWELQHEVLVHIFLLQLHLSLHFSKSFKSNSAKEEKSQ